MTATDAQKRASKKWYEANKNKIKRLEEKYREQYLEERKEEYEKNKEYYSNYWKQKMHCGVCNKTFSLSNRLLHPLTKKHLKNLETYVAPTEQHLLRDGFPPTSCCP